MTHPSPEAVERADLLREAQSSALQKWGRHQDAVRIARALAAHVAVLTAQLEAERARQAEAEAEANEVGIRYGFANAQTEIADLNDRLSAETARADKAEAEAKALRAENDTMRGILANSTLDCVYCGLPSVRMNECASGFPGCARADDIAVSATLAQPAADGGDNG